MKRFVRFLFMQAYRKELIAIAKYVRAQIDQDADIYSKSVGLNRKYGMLKALEDLDLLPR